VVLCCPLLGKLPFVPASFAKLSIDECPKVIGNPIAIHQRNFSIHCFPPNGSIGVQEKVSDPIVSPSLKHKWIEANSAFGCAWPGRESWKEEAELFSRTQDTLIRAPRIISTKKPQDSQDPAALLLISGAYAELV
jgi:hypothetical protein